MPDATLRIKNLSIALEALSRVNTQGSNGLMQQIAFVLEQEVDQLEKENQEPIKPPPRSTDPADDDIPF